MNFEPPEPKSPAPACVRPGEAHDLPAIQAIYAHHVRFGLASFELEPPSVEEMARRRDALVQGGFPYFVAEVDGRVAGYGYAGPYRPRPAYRHTVENSIYVGHEFQRLGLGRRLLARLIETCTDAGFRQMIAVIGDSDNIASIELHRALGFREVGTFDAVGYKHGRWLDSVLMQRPLGPGRTTPPDD